jgi:phosphoribosylaminoimidazole carboxylase (NCAIR synthetase)
LGRMLALAAAPLGIRCIALDPGGASSPAGQVCPGSLAGSFTDPAAIRELASIVDVLTVEIEHVNADALAAAGAAAGVPVHPAPATVRLIQDKLLQKEAMKAKGVPLGWFERADTESELHTHIQVRKRGATRHGSVLWRPFLKRMLKNNSPQPAQPLCFTRPPPLPPTFLSPLQPNCCRV